jgi:hypothetical protein
MLPVSKGIKIRYNKTSQSDKTVYRVYLDDDISQKEQLGVNRKLFWILASIGILLIILAVIVFIMFVSI